MENNDKFFFKLSNLIDDKLWDKYDESISNRYRTHVIFQLVKKDAITIEVAARLLEY